MSSDAPRTTAGVSLSLLVAINLFDFIDRYILAAVEPSIRATFFSPGDPNAMWWSGTLSTAFVLSYMISAPALGWLADRYPRWTIIGIAAIIWSIATAASGLASTFVALFVARIFVGIGEGAYGPAAPPIISDLFPKQTRSTALAIFFAAVPTGAAFGYILGGLIDVHMGWRSAFYVVSGPGVLLGYLCLVQKDPRASKLSNQNHLEIPLRNYFRSLRVLMKRPSYGLNVAAQTAMVFAGGGLAYWMPAYLQFRQQPSSATGIFGGVVACSGLTSTMVGGLLADRLRPWLRGSDLLVSGMGMLIGFPFLVAMLFAPFPYAWIFLFCAVFFIYFNTGPSNAATANVSMPSIRAMAFAFNLLIIHALGDAIAPPLLGFVAGHTNLNNAFLAISAMMLISGVLWLIGAKYLPADVASVEVAERFGSRQNLQDV